MQKLIKLFNFAKSGHTLSKYKITDSDSDSLRMDHRAFQFTTEGSA